MILVDSSIVIYAARPEHEPLRRRLGDSVIATTTLVEGLTLLTHNTGDYSWIEGLGVEDPLPSS